ncbi:MAG: hypothetical protein JKY84_01800 [Emcibacteraceae bacterium]|nr:hypothetical protein [Emcibacteraceae bacterium]
MTEKFLANATQAGHYFFPDNLTDRQARKRAYAMAEDGCPHIRRGKTYYFHITSAEKWWLNQLSSEGIANDG